MESEGHLPAFAYTVTFEMNLNPFAKDTVNLLAEKHWLGAHFNVFQRRKNISLVLCLDP